MPPPARGCLSEAKTGVLEIPSFILFYLKNLSTSLTASGSAKTATRSYAWIWESPTAMNDSLPRIMPPMMAFLGKFMSLRVCFVIFVSGATMYSRISALVPLMYFMKRTLLLRVNLKIRPAVMSFC